MGADMVDSSRPAAGPRARRYARTLPRGRGWKDRHVTPTPAPVRILALGGSTTPMAASERALRIAGAAAERAGAEVEYLTGRDLMVPIYDTETRDRDSSAARLVDALRRCDGLLVATPGYHGSISGMIKNALDYCEDLRNDDRPYLHGRAVGCIAVAHGWQTAVGTLHQMRQVVHALRGWPTPLGCAINDATGLLGVDEATTDMDVVRQLQTLGQQVAEFGTAQHAMRQA
jgi:FMN reductase